MHLKSTKYIKRSSSDWLLCLWLWRTHVTQTFRSYQKTVTNSKRRQQSGVNGPYVTWWGFKNNSHQYFFTTKHKQFEQIAVIRTAASTWMTSAKTAADGFCTSFLYISWINLEMMSFFVGKVAFYLKTNYRKKSLFSFSYFCLTRIQQFDKDTIVHFWPQLLKTSVHKILEGL